MAGVGTDLVLRTVELELAEVGHVLVYARVGGQRFCLVVSPLGAAGAGYRALVSRLVLRLTHDVDRRPRIDVLARRGDHRPSSASVALRLSTQIWTMIAFTLSFPPVEFIFWSKSCQELLFSVVQFWTTIALV